MSPPPAAGAPRLIEVTVQLRAGSFVKRRSDGTIDYLAPLPSPFSYGEVRGTRSADGDAVDVLVWRARPAAGTTVRLPLQGAVDFVDAGADDPKLVCAAAPLRPWERRCILAWFAGFARAKALLAATRGATGRTWVRGWLDAATAAARLDAEAGAGPDGDLHRGATRGVGPSTGDD